jgi:signal transduction histidine kinase
MIRDLLEYTRTRLGRAIPVLPRSGSMEQICKSAVDEVRAVHPERVFRLETSGELEGLFDSERLQQVLCNLLNNAVQHGAMSEPITLRAYGEPDEITVQVRNHGRPIPSNELQVIFDPLVQIPPATVSGEGGNGSGNLGLGLYIAREIVTMHGGTLRAESSDHGTVFSAHLPRVPAEALRAA